MGKFISPEVRGRVAKVMFGQFENSPRERVFRGEMERYIPELSSLYDEVIAERINYWRSVFLENVLPTIGTPIASLNPAFVESIESIAMGGKKFTEVYNRGSMKENGYRMQLHIGPHDSPAIPDASGFTRQFTPYDLRMFPELHELFAVSPVMIGDSELISANFDHLNGFSRVKKRAPQGLWPKRGSDGITDEQLAAYLANPVMFKDGMPHHDFEMALSFHGLLAISHPDTWNSSREEQLSSLESLMSIPMDYRQVDKRLDQLAGFLKDRDLNARVVERQVLVSQRDLKTYVQAQFDKDLEGAVIVRTAVLPDGSLSLDHHKTIKLKKYDPVDMILLGVHLKDRSLPPTADNIKEGVFGLYDDNYACYLPACKANLDPDGVQVPKDRKPIIRELRQEIADILAEKEEGTEPIYTLYDVYVMQAKWKLNNYLGDQIDPEAVEALFDAIPKGQTFPKLFERYQAKQEEYEFGELGTKASHTKGDKVIQEYKGVFKALREFEEVDPRRHKELTDYFAKLPEIRNTSAKFVKPAYVVDTTEPLIVELKVFGLEWGLNPFAAGFHSWGMDSYHFNNKYPEQTRPDKGTTTDYKTLNETAKRNTFKAKESK
ncbi:MAG: hypothetical protein KKG59_06920 [Nanoarchaeota archaeon]|nr:hypothetical protein [Nanoarchaeota archaeon]